MQEAFQGLGEQFRYETKYWTLNAKANIEWCNNKTNKHVGIEQNVKAAEKGFLLHFKAEEIISNMSHFSSFFFLLCYNLALVTPHICLQCKYVQCPVSVRLNVASLCACGCKTPPNCFSLS